MVAPEPPNSGTYPTANGAALMRETAANQRFVAAGDAGRYADIFAESVKSLLTGNVFVLQGASHMNQEQRAKWERNRAKGVWRFVLLYGVLTSVSMIVAVTIFDYFTSPGGVTLDRLKIRVPIFLVSGFVAGLVIWFIGEYRYRQGSVSGS